MGFTDTAKDVWKLAQAAGNAELVAKTTQAIVEASDLAERNATLIGENADLKDRLRTLEAADDLKSRLRVGKANTTYYVRRKDGGKEDGPYCTVCYDTKDRLVLMHFVGPHSGYIGVDEDDQWHCPSCKTFGKAE